MELSSTQRPETRSEITRLIETVIDVLPEIKTVLARERGASGKTNPSGDTQKVADDKIDQLLFDAIVDLDGFGEFLSEEREDIEDIGSGLSVATDPLDGSSNIQTNTTIGTIIGVYDAPLPAVGRDLIASIFVVFGPLTTVGVAANDELVEYIVQDGEIIDAERLTMPESGGIWSFSGRPTEWTPALRSYKEVLSERYKLRYSGAMIADVRLLLSYGGLLGYPTRSTKPDGVLRLQYESNPIAYAVECAGGAGSTGSQRILDLEPEGRHQRVPTYFGNQALIDDLETRLKTEA
jgi:fructose-1,6-bisphosphatase I